MHLEEIFQIYMSGPDTATTPVVCTSELKIEFYPKGLITPRDYGFFL